MVSKILMRAKHEQCGLEDLRLVGLEAEVQHTLILYRNYKARKAEIQKKLLEISTTN